MSIEDDVLKHFKVIIAGLLISVLIVSLDSTITSTAMPKIIASLGGLQYYVWPFTIYLTTLIISAMLSGKLSDFYGSKKIFIIAIIVFVSGSILCGFSQTMTQLIIFRALMGFGAGIIVTIPLKIIAQMFPSRQRGKYMGLFAAVGGISTVVGPTLGGYITDSLGWQWIFFVNVPIGIIALSVIIPYLPEFTVIVKEKIMDYWGIITFTAGLISFLLALTFIEENSTIPFIYLALLFIFAAIMLIGFIYTEIKAREPILPMYLFKNSIFSISSICMILLGAVMLVGAVYIPLFLQLVQGFTPSTSGTYLTPLMFSMIVSSILSGQIISKTGKYKNLAIISFAIGILGMFLLSTLDTNTTNLELIVYEIIAGIGAGLAIPIFTVAAQNAVTKRDLGVVTSATMYFRFLGGVIGLAVLGAIVNMTLNLNLTTAKVHVSSSLLVTAIHNVFIIAVVMNIIGFVLCFFLKDLYMSNEMESDEEIGYEDAPGEI
ncbi:MAG: MDR family MFS transporter [Methanobacterium sp.]